MVTDSDLKYLGELIILLNHKFALNDLKQLSYFLSVVVKRTYEGLCLSQHMYFYMTCLKA